MPVKWKLFWVICLLQMLAAAFFTIMAVIHFFGEGGFSAFIRILLFLLIFLLAVLGVNILTNNYPDVPVTGRQKTNFNRLFLLNFLFLSFLFGVIFSEYRQLSEITTLTGRAALQLPVEFFIYLIIYLIMLVFQLILLYGLYILRRELYVNFMSKEFEFEKDQLL